MDKIKIITTGKRYISNKVKVKINRARLFKILFLILVLGFIIVGVLWLIGI